MKIPQIFIEIVETQPVIDNEDLVCLKKVYCIHSSIYKLLGITLTSPTVSTHRLTVHRNGSSG